MSLTNRRGLRILENDRKVLRHLTDLKRHRHVQGQCPFRQQIRIRSRSQIQRLQDPDQVRQNLRRPMVHPKAKAKEMAKEKARSLVGYLIRDPGRKRPDDKLSRRDGGRKSYWLANYTIDFTAYVFTKVARGHGSFLQVGSAKVHTVGDLGVVPDYVHSLPSQTALKFVIPQHRAKGIEIM